MCYNKSAKERFKEGIIMCYVFENETYIELSEFAEMVKKKPETILKRKNDIPVIKKFGTEWYALTGTRYPCKVKSFKIKCGLDRRYVLLKAIDDYKYVNSKMLGIFPNEFNMMIRDFLNVELIEENYNGNTYGANAYTTTCKGEKIIKKSKTTATKIIKSILKECATLAGCFVGEVVSRTFPTL